MLPWYLRPIEPSRVVPLWVWHVLPSALVLAFFVSFVTFLGVPTPDAFHDHSFPLMPIAAWAGAASAVVRRRQLGGRSPGVSVPGITLLAVAVTVLVVPSFIWPRWSEVQPVTGVVAVTSLLCWGAAGILSAVGLYFVVADAFGTPRRRTS